MAIVTASADASTEVKPFTAHAHGTPAGASATSRRRPIGIAIPIATPAGARSATDTATRTANGRSINARRRGWSPNAAPAVITTTAASAAVSVPRAPGGHNTHHPPPPRTGEGEANHRAKGGREPDGGPRRDHHDGRERSRQRPARRAATREQRAEPGEHEQREQHDAQGVRREAE